MASICSTGQACDYCQTPLQVVHVHKCCFNDLGEFNSYARSTRILCSQCIVTHPTADICVRCHLPALANDPRYSGLPNLVYLLHTAEAIYGSHPTIDGATDYTSALNIPGVQLTVKLCRDNSISRLLPDAIVHGKITISNQDYTASLYITIRCGIVCQWHWAKDTTSHINELFPLIPLPIPLVGTAL